MDGEQIGRVKCTLANWTGVGYKLPRGDLEKCKDRSDLFQSGVYFLFGTDDATGESVVYVGQANVRKNEKGVLGRLLEHKRNPEKNYWTEAVAFVTKDETGLDATKISWLENRFCMQAKNAGRYVVKNGNESSPGKPSEEIVSDLETFAEYAEEVVSVLGYKVFVPIRKQSVQSISVVETASEIECIDFFMEQKMKNSGITVKGHCQRTNEGFVVLKGSVINPEINADTCSGVAKKSREQSKIDENNLLLEDVLLPSPSAAAMIVTGASANGYSVWKTKEGKTLEKVVASEE